MIDPKQFRDLVIDPTLKFMDLYSPSASELLLGTAIQESRLTYLTQIDGDDDPFDHAMGVFQTEKVTINDIWDNWLIYQPDVAAKLMEHCNFKFRPSPKEVIWNLRYATVMARLHYRRVKEALPAAGDLEGQARYWKKYYNTSLGKGTAEEYVKHFKEALKK